jgi:hypothetical protein
MTLDVHSQDSLPVRTVPLRCVNKVQQSLRGDLEAFLGINVMIEARSSTAEAALKIGILLNFKRN